MDFILHIMPILVSLLEQYS